MSLFGLDENGNTIINLDNYLAENSSDLISGRNEDEPSKSILVYKLDEPAVNKLDSAEKLLFNASFETTNYPEIVEFYATDVLNLQLSADINVTVEVE